MNKRLGLVLLFALVISGAASLLIYRAVSARIARADTSPRSRVLVAVRDVSVGMLLKDSDVHVVDWTGSVPDHAVKTEADAIGRGVTSNIFAGEPIMESRLAPKGAGAGLAATIPVGMRAVAVRVNEVVGVSGFAVPGMRVDILILGNPTQGGNAGTMSKTLLQNLEVLSAGQQIQKDNEGKPMPVQVVNLLVTPEQAEILSLASNDARIQLILRNPLDNEETETKGSHLNQLFVGKAPQLETLTPAPKKAYKPAPPKPVVAEVIAPKPTPPLVVEVFHSSKGGTRKTETKFEQHTDQEK